MVTSENYFGRWGNTKENRREILFTDSQIRSLDADWSYPDDPARVLAAVGRLNPSVNKKMNLSRFATWSGREFRITFEGWRGRF